MLDIKFFLKEGPEVRDRYREHIFEDAKDVFGKHLKNIQKIMVKQNVLIHLKDK